MVVSLSAPREWKKEAEIVQQVHALLLTYSQREDSSQLDDELSDNLLLSTDPSTRVEIEYSGKQDSIIGSILEPLSGCANLDRLGLAVHFIHTSIDALSHHRQVIGRLVGTLLHYFIQHWKDYSKNTINYSSSDKHTYSSLAIQFSLCTLLSFYETCTRELLTTLHSQDNEDTSILLIDMQIIAIDMLTFVCTLDKHSDQENQCLTLMLISIYTHLALKTWNNHTTTSIDYHQILSILHSSCSWTREMNLHFVLSHGAFAFPIHNNSWNDQDITRLLGPVVTTHFDAQTQRHTNHLDHWIQNLLAKMHSSFLQNSQTVETMTMIHHLISYVGIHTMASIIRAHFFARLFPNKTSRTSDANTSNDFHDNSLQNEMGWNSNEPDIYPKDPPPFQHQPTRYLVLISFVKNLHFPHFNQQVLHHLLPIIYTLIDSIDPSCQALGGALLIYILDESTPTTWFFTDSDILPKQDPRVLCRQDPTSLYSTSNLPHSFLNKPISTTTFFQTTVHVLSSRAIPSCRHVLALSILCKAYSRIMDMASNHPLPLDSLSSSTTLRRKATLDLMSLVSSLPYTPEDDLDKETGNESTSNSNHKMDLIHSVFIGGIFPLLVQHSNLPNGDAMELFRPGFKSLIPLLRFETLSISTCRVQLCTMSCLLTLYKGALPIVHRHGGKLMSELLAYVGRVSRSIRTWKTVRDRQGLDDESILVGYTLDMAVHASAVTLMVCKVRAGEILQQVKQGPYEKNLQSWCKKIELLMPSIEEKYSTSGQTTTIR